jgi:hypothetical protein
MLSLELINTAHAMTKNLMWPDTNRVDDSYQRAGHAIQGCGVRKTAPGAVNRNERKANRDTGK